MGKIFINNEAFVCSAASQFLMLFEHLAVTIIQAINAEVILSIDRRESRFNSLRIQPRATLDDLEHVESA
jgi:hypothetical protein